LALVAVISVIAQAFLLRQFVVDGGSEASLDGRFWEVPMSPLIVVITAEPGHWEALSDIVSSCGFRPVRCGTLADAKELFGRHHFRLALCDDVLPDGSFRELLDFFKQDSGFRMPLIVVSRIDEWGCFLDAMVSGAFDYVAFPPYPNELERALAAAFTATSAHRKGTLKPAA
jgi:DNA-binding NtrC family response regulator